MDLINSFLPHNTLYTIMTLQPTQTTQEILTERGSLYGKFSGHARVTQDLKEILKSAICANFNFGFTPSQFEALDMICHKLGRIVNGDPNYADSWVDIAGYAQLIVDELNGESK